MEVVTYSFTCSFKSHKWEEMDKIQEMNTHLRLIVKDVLQLIEGLQIALISCATALSQFARLSQ